MPRRNPRIEKYREAVLEKIREGYWGRDLGRLFPQVARTTMISWAAQYLKPEEIPDRFTRKQLPESIKTPERVRVKITASKEKKTRSVPKPKPKPEVVPEVAKEPEKVIEATVVEPTKPPAKPVAVEPPLPPINLSPTRKETATYFNYSVSYEEAIADIDQARNWIQEELIKAADTVKTPLEKVKVLTALASVITDREKCLRAERELVESVTATEEDTKALLEYLASQDRVSMEVFYE